MKKGNVPIRRAPKHINIIEIDNGFIGPFLSTFLPIKKDNARIRIVLKTIIRL